MKNTKLASVLKKAEMISKAIELEAEDILEDAELAVKETVPACNVTAALNHIEQKLASEGVEALFQKKVSKVAMNKTASEALSDKEVKELADLIVDAIVEEFEEILEEADEVCDEEVNGLGEDVVEVESKLKSVLERKLAAKGINAKFARNKKSTATRAKEAMAAKRSKRSNTIASKKSAPRKATKR